MTVREVGFVKLKLGVRWDDISQVRRSKTLIVMLVFLHTSLVWALKVILLSIVTPSTFKSVDDWIYSRLLRQ